MLPGGRTLSCSGSLFFLFERVAGAPVLDEGMGMIRAGSPIAARIDEFFFGDEKPAIAAFQLFVFNLVIAGLPECCKLLLHASPCGNQAT
jgi:hypothetical protein